MGGASPAKGGAGSWVRARERKSAQTHAAQGGAAHTHLLVRALHTRWRPSSLRAAGGDKRAGEGANAEGTAPPHPHCGSERARARRPAPTPPPRARTDAHELVAPVAAREHHGGRAEEVLGRDLGRVRRGRLEHEAAHAEGHGAHEHRVERLVKLLRLGAAHVHELPVQVLRDGLDAAAGQGGVRGARVRLRRVRARAPHLKVIWNLSGVRNGAVPLRHSTLSSVTDAIARRGAPRRGPRGEPLRCGAPHTPARGSRRAAAPNQHGTHTRPPLPRGGQKRATKYCVYTSLIP